MAAHHVPLRRKLSLGFAFFLFGEKNQFALNDLEQEMIVFRAVNYDSSGTAQNLEEQTLVAQGPKDDECLL